MIMFYSLNLVVMKMLKKNNKTTPLPPPPPKKKKKTQKTRGHADQTAPEEQSD